MNLISLLYNLTIFGKIYVAEKKTDVMPPIHNKFIKIALQNQAVVIKLLSNAVTSFASACFSDLLVIAFKNPSLTKSVASFKDFSLNFNSLQRMKFYNILTKQLNSILQLEL